MDPQATWHLLICAYAQKDWQQALDAAEALLLWMRRGGYPPQSMPGCVMADQFNRAVVAAACRFVIADCQLRSV